MGADDQQKTDVTAEPSDQTESKPDAVQVEVEDVGPCKKLLKIEVAGARVQEELEKTYGDLNENVVVPGFRKGHAPRWLMESRFGKQVNADAKEALIAESFDQAVKSHELKPIGQPKFDEEIKLEPGKGLTFGVTLEVRPEFEIDDYTGLVLKKASVTPSKAEIKDRIEAIRRRYAKLEDVAKGSPKPEDVVVCTVRLKEGDETYREIPNHQFIVGDHVLIGMDPEETVEFVTGAAVGETVEKEITVPEGHADEAKRGAKMVLSLSLEQIRRPLLPEVTEEWVSEMGFDTLEEFNEEIKTAVRRQKDREAESDFEKQLDEQLLTKVDFELPEDVIGEMAEGQLTRRSMDLRYRGVPAEEIEQHLEELKTASRESAEKNAKLFFILNAIAEKERIFVTEDEVAARIEAIASNYNRSPEQIRRELEQGGRLSELRSSMRDEKVRTFLREKATIKEPKSSQKKAGKSGK